MTVSVRTVSRHLVDPTGENNLAPRRIHARWPCHMVHLDLKEIGVIPDGGGWRVHGRGQRSRKQSVRSRERGGRGRYTYLHTAIDGYSRLACTEAMPDERARTAISFSHRARAFFARHGIRYVHRSVTDMEPATNATTRALGNADRFSPDPA